MSEPLCPKCKRPYPDGWTVNLRKRQAAAISKSLQLAKENGDPVGRPAIIHHELIWELADKGFSQQKIADHFEISRGAVCHALRKRKTK